MGHGNQRPKIEHVEAFMPVLVTRNFDDDSIKMNELEWRDHFPNLPQNIMQPFPIPSDADATHKIG